MDHNVVTLSCHAHITFPPTNHSHFMNWSSSLKPIICIGRGHAFLAGCNLQHNAWPTKIVIYLYLLYPIHDVIFIGLTLFSLKQLTKVQNV